MKPIEGNPTGIKAYRALLSLALEHKLYFLLAVTGMIIFAASDAAFAYMMKPLMDEGFIDRDPTIIKLIPVAIILIFVVRMVAVFMRSYCMNYIGRAVINTLRTMMFEKLLTMTSDEYDQSSSAAIVARFSYDVEQVANSVSSSLTVFIQDSLRIIVLLAYMIWLNWQLTAIFLVAGPIVFLIVVKISARFRRISRNIQQSMGGVTQVAQEVIDSNRIVKIFGGDDFERKKFHDVNQENLKLHLKMSIAQSFSAPLIQLIVAIAFAAIVAFATSESMRDVISTGDFVSFIFAMTMLLAPMRVLSSINASIQQGIAAGESVFELTSRDSEHNEGRLPLERAEGRLSFRNVVLRYRRSEQRVLDEISFDVEPFQTVAIVGRSGSGKSSLVNLIPRLYEYDSGEVLLDGERLDRYRIEDLRRQIAYVGQDVRLFNDTIRNNIAYGIADKVDEAQIIEAAKQAHAWEFIEQMPGQLDAEVGERGVLLSGGQRQRIAIARALLKDAPILILDEATSALDTESERFIQHAMEHLMENRTTLVIAHRLSTIEHADHILVMDQGKVLEQGSHAELLGQGGIYAKLHSMQFRDAGDGELQSTNNRPKIIRSSTLNKSLMHNWVSLSTQRRQGWWLWSMNPLSILLMPLALFFYVAVKLRRLAYRLHLLRSRRLPVLTIVVGNITLGGNGKTPIVIALHQLLSDRGYRPAIITRGYKSGHENIAQVLHDGGTVNAVGDEANMMSEVCRCPIGVGSDRITTATEILRQFPDTDVILCDDGLQHYALQRDIEIAVCRQLSLGNGLLLPAGPLREPRERLREVDITIDRDSDQVVESIGEVWNLVDPEQKRHISEFHRRQVHALAGIGFPEIFFASLMQMGIEVIEHEFPDHHEFSAQDLDLKPELPVFVTHKDAVKLKGIARPNLWVVPLHIELSEDLSKQILELVEARHRG
ncbi:MAG: lipid A export permease/ATP-binding protein MsbA [Gammaproteobacteria bacterium]|nr:lipid A export permease/ATP-binding protein MsbA [Gammaproteobacteria bacterium]MDH3449573.1 lipid A export permease/ATP-binding protein MsbA [Gammaproteobacteria bacterium]